MDHSRLNGWYFEMMSCGIGCVQLLTCLSYKTGKCESTKDTNWQRVSHDLRVPLGILLPNSCSSTRVLVASSADVIVPFESAIILNNFKSIATLAHIYVEG
jgi:hypothetical protein